MRWAGNYTACALPYVVPAEQVFAIVSAAICREDGWQPVDARVIPGPRAWRQSTHDGPALTAVLVGLFPRIVVVCPAAPAPSGRGRHRRAFARIVAEVGRHSGREVVPEELEHLVEKAGATFATWCATVQRLELLEREMNTRTCRRCGGLCPGGGRWCPHCENEFSAAEDHEFDLALARLRTEQRQLVEAMHRLTSTQLQPPARSAGPAMGGAWVPGVPR
jgi:hypothetical protein